MAKVQHLFGPVARKNIGQMTDPEAHFGPKRSGEELAGDIRRIDRRGRLTTIVAIAAALRGIFAEVGEENEAATGRRFDQRSKRIQTLALASAALGFNFSLDPLPGA